MNAEKKIYMEFFCAAYDSIVWIYNIVLCMQSRQPIT